MKFIANNDSLFSFDGLCSLSSYFPNSFLNTLSFVLDFLFHCFDPEVSVSLFEDAFIDVWVMKDGFANFEFFVTFDYLCGLVVYYVL